MKLVLEAKAQVLIARKTQGLDALIRSDFVYFNAIGRIFDKAGYIHAYCTSGKVLFTQQRFSNLAVKLVEDFAVTTLSISDEPRIDERVVIGCNQLLCAFSKKTGFWLWVAGQTMTTGAP